MWFILSIPCIWLWYFFKGQSLPFKEVSGGYWHSLWTPTVQTTPNSDAVLILTPWSWPFSLRRTALAPFTKAVEIHYPRAPWKNQRLNLKPFLWPILSCGYRPVLQGMSPPAHIQFLFQHRQSQEFLIYVVLLLLRLFFHSPFYSFSRVDFRKQQPKPDIILEAVCEAVY